VDPIKIHLEHVKQQLDSVSSSYCVAKWQQVTIHLATGQTHSCHHPATHHIPLEEIAVNPSALHNTKFKKQQRKLMLEGQRPSECDYCWRAEDSPGDHFSDRVHKSADPKWGKPFLKESAAMPWDADVTPAYVEVSFSNVCNFGCAYCSPDISSTIMQEAKRYGPVKLDGGRLDRDIIKLEQQGRMPIPTREHNPYIDAFWAWWPTLYDKLRVFRITGGEPLLAKDTFKVLDWIIAHPNSKLDLAINSNLGVDEKILKEFLEKVNYIQQNKLVKSLKIYTSCDTWGQQAEYIRTGLNYKQWYRTLWDITLRYPALSITVMVTFNLLSIPRFESFLRDMLALRRSPTVSVNNSGMRGIGLDFPYLRHPRYLSSLIADPYMLVMLDRSIQFMRHNTATFQQVDYHDGFYPHEVENLQRVYNIASAEWQGSLENQISRRDFYLYITEHDRRNATDFKTVFPEIGYFYDQCRREYEETQTAKDVDNNEKEET
jgi:organic radical activating enzyme